MQKDLDFNFYSKGSNVEERYYEIYYLMFFNHLYLKSKNRKGHKYIL